MSGFRIEPRAGAGGPSPPEDPPEARERARSGQEGGGQEDHGDEARGGQQHAVAGQGLGRPVAGGVHEDVLGAGQTGGGDRQDRRAHV